MKKMILSFLVVGVVAAASAGVTGKHKISAKAAGKIALARVHGSLAKTPKLEHEDGQWQYEVLIESKGKLTEVNVNAGSGKISSIEKTSAAGEAREGKEKG